MASKFNTLYRGELDDVAALVDANELNNGEIRAVLLNLIERVRRLEASQRHTANIASCLANGIKPD